MAYFGVVTPSSTVHQGRVTMVLDPHRTEPAPKGVLDVRGRLPVLAKLLSRCRACLQCQTQGCTQVVPQNASAVLPNRRLLQLSII